MTNSLMSSVLGPVAKGTVQIPLPRPSRGISLNLRIVGIADRVSQGRSEVPARVPQAYVAPQAWFARLMSAGLLRTIGRTE